MPPLTLGYKLKIWSQGVFLTTGCMCSIEAFQQKRIRHYSQFNVKEIGHVCIMATCWLGPTNATFFVFLLPAIWKGPKHRKCLIFSQYLGWSASDFYR